ncbi:hypothetical protein [uncultured Hyphomonas sp.]|jgi:acyl carrier protein|uniref:hypothetical protein n=1 Tax=uncultured Hyphomonas sp. TaxID=225298 RepID=UPI000C633E6F|nr:hypothetical protein [Hyphomonadaceae bacterium]MBA28460.1 hypothetical protein [Hyphomonadaceae bacterium]MBL4878525.1 hypothetical protein [Hyphomonas sp.]|tara:strand:+ start:9549 stop:9857 length:309 start_codon:yes stop_codon:yes gene_type:complete
MSLQRTDALQAIYNAIEEMNPQLKPERQLQAAEDAVIYGESAPLDSLDLVNLIMAVEQHIMDLTGDELVLASEAAMSRKRSPYRSVGALADYAIELASEPAA